MLNRALDNPTTCDDDGQEQADETLVLDAAALREALSSLASAVSPGALRGAVDELRRRVDAGELRAQAGEAGAVELSRGYLLADLNQIAESRTRERAEYYVARLIRGIGEVRTGPINDINLRRWKEYAEIQTDSLWIIERRDGSGVHTANYWGNFVPQIPRQMMLRYTKRGDWVLDPFAGAGTTLIEGQRLGRNTIGLELQQRMVDHTRKLIASEPNPHDVACDMIATDSAAADYGALLNRYGQRSAQLVILHPPYFDIIKFSDDPRDLSNLPTVEAFLEMIGRVVAGVAPILDSGRHLALVIGDKYARGDWIPLGFQTMNEVMKHGFALKSIVVKNFDQTAGKRAQKELWRYRALVGGFYIFKHEYIFLFKKQ
ncbi:MAG TPA: DNA methyltransferase [Roseiflexaceae bacterium]|nr:DNA methyltransferase [Roseiflexaceae bacterium]